MEFHCRDCGNKGKGNCVSGCYHDVDGIYMHCIYCGTHHKRRGKTAHLKSCKPYKELEIAKITNPLENRIAQLEETNDILRIKLAVQNFDKRYKSTDCDIFEDEFIETHIRSNSTQETLEKISKVSKIGYIILNKDTIEKYNLGTKNTTRVFKLYDDIKSAFEDV